MMDLKIELSEDKSANNIWIKDVTPGYGQGGYIPVTGITGAVITFLKQNPVTLDYSDHILADVTLTFTGLVVTSIDDLRFNINASDVFGQDVTVFPEGIYYIKYSISGSGGTVPDNNSTYVTMQVLTAQTDDYYSRLLLKVAREASSKIEDEYLFWYTVVFGAKLEALQYTISIEDYTTIRTSLQVIQDLQTKYPKYNDSRRYYRTPFRG